MPRGRTHYQVLGVSRDSSSIEIANAVRDKLAELKEKPGSSATAEAAIREAYQVLANPDMRAEYDAELPPDAAMLAAQKAAAKGPGVTQYVKDIAEEAGLVKLAIPDSGRARARSHLAQGPPGLEADPHDRNLAAHRHAAHDAQRYATDCRARRTLTHIISAAVQSVAECSSSDFHGSRGGFRRCLELGCEDPDLRCVGAHGCAG